ATSCQRVRQVQPVHHGKSVIAVPQHSVFVSLQEGTDFSLLRTSGQSLSGPLQKLDVSNPAPAQILPGAIVLFSGDVGPQGSALMRRAFAGGARAVLRIDAALTPERLQSNLSERRPVQPHVGGVDKPAMSENFSLVGVTKDAG